MCSVSMNLIKDEAFIQFIAIYHLIKANTLLSIVDSPAVQKSSQIRVSRFLG